jgi:hypothetical protein
MNDVKALDSKDDDTDSLHVSWTSLNLIVYVHNCHSYQHGCVNTKKLPKIKNKRITGL